MTSDTSETGDGRSSDSERLERVEDDLHSILSELDADELESGVRVRVEYYCQKIHVAFGGDDPEAIYRDLQDEVCRGEAA